VWGSAAAVAAAYALTLWHVQPLWHDDVALFTHAAAHFPEAAAYSSALGSALMARGDLAAAEHPLRVALSMDPGNAQTWHALGLVHGRLGLFDVAERELQTALSLNSENGEILYDLGHVHARLGRTAEAASEIAKGLDLMPHPPADAYVELAELYDAQGRPADSGAVLKRMESMPGGAEAAGLALARIRLRHGDGAGAEKILRDLARRYPSDQHVWTMLGLVLAGEDRNQEALAAYQHALALAPNDSRPHFYAAQAFHAMGREREALAQCQAALAINPAYADATALMAEIGRGQIRR
ncbi:MAG: tetratricopeptide repeat protein, partial [Candidatus Binataceae bacterium]